MQPRSRHGRPALRPGHAGYLDTDMEFSLRPLPVPFAVFRKRVCIRIAARQPIRGILLQPPAIQVTASCDRIPDGEHHAAQREQIDEEQRRERQAVGPFNASRDRRGGATSASASTKIPIGSSHGRSPRTSKSRYRLSHASPPLAKGNAITMSASRFVNEGLNIPAPPSSHADKPRAATRYDAQATSPGLLGPADPRRMRSHPVCPAARRTR